ncbi:MAG: peptide deformylase [Cognaticolwellia sp.]|jgi:peptide deformylase
MPQKQITLSSILRFGDPRLACNASSVDFSEPDIIQDLSILNESLILFQQVYNWGRSIAAPQVGIMKRIIAINAPDLPKVLINPEITWHSTETQIVWDDCMSLPEIAVKVERWKLITVKYQTLDGGVEFLEDLSPENSELLQHEIDHLNGILMTHRMTDTKQIIAREFIKTIGF